MPSKTVNSFPSKYAHDSFFLVTDRDINRLKMKANQVLENVITRVEATRIFQNQQKSQT